MSSKLSYNRDSTNLRSGGSQGKGILLEPTLLVIPERTAPESNVHLIRAHIHRAKWVYSHPITSLEVCNPFAYFVNFSSNVHSKYSRECHNVVEGALLLHFPVSGIQAHSVDLDKNFARSWNILGNVVEGKRSKGCLDKEGLLQFG